MIRHMEENFSIRGEKPAISFFRQGSPETDLSFADLKHEIERMARTLYSNGVRKGERVMLFLPKSLILVVTHLAALRIGAVSVPIHPDYRKDEVDVLIRNAEPRLILAGLEQQKLLGEIDPHGEVLAVDTRLPYQEMDFSHAMPGNLPALDPSPADPAVIIYTSGTTGSPKGAVLTHENLLHDARNICKAWEITEADVLCHALPLSHVHGLCFALHTCLLAGAHVLLLDSFSPRSVLDILSRKQGPHGCSVFMGVPAMYSRMIDCLGGERRDFGHVRLWTSGSAPLPEKGFEDIAFFFGRQPVEREGMTETGMNFSNPLHGERRSGSIGIALPDLEVRVVDPQTCSDVQPGETGEFWLRSPSIIPGYWRNPQENARAFRDGWFRTGDLGHVDPDGYFHLTDRSKDIIISGGENISPSEVEKVIRQLVDVKESCVIGIPDPKWGEKVVAAVVLRPGSGLKAEDIHAFCRRQLHPWKCPKEFFLVEALPRNTMGKILKKELIKRLA